MTTPYYYTEPIPDSVTGEIPMINRTYKVRIPNGEVYQVNRFDYNLMYAAKAWDKWIQLSNMGWIPMGRLTVLNSGKEACQ